MTATLSPLRRGRADPSTRVERGAFWRATRNIDGPVTVCVEQDGQDARVHAWGAGAARALEDAAVLLGAHDDPSAFRPVHPILRDAHRRLSGVRQCNTQRPSEAITPSIIEQKVTSMEAHGTYQGLIRRFGEPAPGPVPLRLPPEPSVLAALPYYAYHPFGLERRRADTVRRAAAHAERLDQCAHLPVQEAYARMLAVPGVGAWTAAEVAGIALGDLDAVSVGDYHLKNVVSFFFTGERRGTDERMLELLEPYRGHRARVLRTIGASGIAPARRGPRMSPNDFASR